MRTKQQEHYNRREHATILYSGMQSCRTRIQPSFFNLVVQRVMCSTHSVVWHTDLSMQFLLSFILPETKASAFL